MEILEVAPDISGPNWWGDRLQRTGSAKALNK